MWLPCCSAMGVHYQSNFDSQRKYLVQLMSNMSNVFTFSLKPIVSIMSKFIVRKNVGGMLIEEGNWIIIDNEMIVTERGSGLNLGKCEINKYISLLMVFVIVNDNLHRKVLYRVYLFLYIYYNYYYFHVYCHYGKYYQIKWSLWWALFFQLQMDMFNIKTISNWN